LRKAYIGVRKRSCPFTTRRKKMNYEEDAKYQVDVWETFKSNIFPLIWLISVYSIILEFTKEINVVVQTVNTPGLVLVFMFMYMATVLKLIFYVPLPTTHYKHRPPAGPTG
jgi:hypothetical protein